MSLLNRLQELLKEGQALTDFEYDEAARHNWRLEGARIKEEARFGDVYIERVDKESEDMIQTENASFLNTPLTYVKKHQKEFIYIESKWFDVVKVDGLAIEWDEVFQTYTVLFGLKRPKKDTGILKDMLSPLNGAQLQFNGEDGLFDVNLQLLELEDIHEDTAFIDVISAVYRFLFRMIMQLEINESKNGSNS
ncbi:branched-chain amino acid aminotransferase [Bacillus safensis]|uniref:branched-chain amino acid aminotransferase n=1 Tax=Bacillus safensis TaxID=561879 RepID=UPI0020A6FDC0|nr:branched-chain amino acid aminotransferase [Bacillus safensis]MCW4644722.1 branched-chain amino acid aminotransferase [Bacillus safensis]MCY7563474.1 branched-chain amino acid aminotransferase [Bacillus safensis]MCY7625199.1 branched-chain amino acid aminotransferase [Bacillus safensis]MCY7648678.1 branched-chain amino acid aminotransferase [Bacillus safensis]MCY7653996.1 branched-chain amino acid aminotransferase [Bacillus safensis]